MPNKLDKCYYWHIVTLAIMKYKLLQERINHIENLQNIKYVAENNIQASQSNILGVIAGIIMETLEQLTGGIIQNKKEKNFYIDQDT